MRAKSNFVEVVRPAASNAENSEVTMANSPGKSWSTFRLVPYATNAVGPLPAAPTAVTSAGRAFGPGPGIARCGNRHHTMSPGLGGGNQPGTRPAIRTGS